MKGEERLELPEVFERLRMGAANVRCGSGIPREPSPLERDFPAICDGVCPYEGNECAECLADCRKLP